MTMTRESDHQPHFNLVDEPWVIVKTPSQQTEALSLLEVFEEASRIESLANENAQQDFAILRVLLAILQRAISPTLDEDDDPAEVWGSLWERSDLPLDDIRTYLSDWHDRFDLFDSEYPFMQVAGLRSKVWDASKLMLASNNKGQLTPTRTGERRATLSFSEAARWLVTIQAFDTAGVKSGVRGDPGLKSGRGYPGGTGWAGRLGGLCAEGGSLRETLLLNLVTCGAEHDELFDEEDIPSWERGSQPAYMAEREPSGRADLYTWQSRRIRLLPEGELITGVMLTVGDKIERGNRQGMEPMSSWRRNESEEKRLGISPVYVPERHRAGRALWRGLGTLLPVADAGETAETLAPGIVGWLGFLSSPNSGRKLSPSYVVHLRGVGIEYDASQQSSIIESIDDYVGMHLFLLSAAGARADRVVLTCVRSADVAVGCLGDFASNLVLASGYRQADGNAHNDSAPSKAKRDARANAYFDLDLAFRSWLFTIDEDSDLVERQMQWARTVRAGLLHIADELMEQTDTRAVVGRSQRRGWMSAGTAYERFLQGLNKALKPIALDTNGGMS